jgi:hypothetical protein
LVATTERKYDMAENGPDDALNDEEIAAAQGGGVAEQAERDHAAILADEGLIGSEDKHK